MSSSDERLREAYRASLEERGRNVRGAQGSHSAHLEPEAFVAIVERSGSEASRLQLLDHIMACASCRRELDLVRASLVAAGVPRQTTWFRSPSVGLVALAATLLVVAGVRLYMASSDPEAGPRLRGGSGVSTHAVRWLPNVGAGLAWSPAAGAESYRVELVDEAGVAVVDTTMRDTTLMVADSVVRDRRGLTWSVTATLGDGSTVTSLPTRLVPPAR
jgi:hypothetical protein